MTDKPKTVEVRIAVAVDKDGGWCSSGADGHKDDDLMNAALGGMGRHEARYWVTATLPIPQPQEVEGQVSDGD